MREDYLNSENDSSSKDKEFENILRPKSFGDFYGQEQIINNFKVFVLYSSLLILNIINVNNHHIATRTVSSY